MKIKWQARKSLVSREHVVEKGPLKISGLVRIGGNLTVQGDLWCTGPLIVLGHLQVTGTLRAADVSTGQGIEVGVDLNAGHLEAHGCEAKPLEEIARDLVLQLPRQPPFPEFGEVDAHEFLADTDTFSDLECNNFHVTALKVGGNCTCLNVDVAGAIEVGGQFNPDSVEAYGNWIDAQSIVAEGDLNCGTLSASQAIWIQGQLQCVTVEATRLAVDGVALVEQSVVTVGTDVQREAEIRRTNLHVDPHYFESNRDPKPSSLFDVAPSLECGELRAGSITAAGSIYVDGELRCNQHLKANRSITAGKSIAVGRGYAIFAGLGVPKSDQHTKGFVCAPQRPRGIAFGEFRELGRRLIGRGLRPIGWNNGRAKTKT